MAIDSLPTNKRVDDQVGKLLSDTETHGWKKAFYEFSKAEIGSGGTVPEDQRIADWKYLLPLNRDTRALVFGCGWGTVAVALSEICGTVGVIDSDCEKLSFLNGRKKQQRIDNLYPIYVKDRSGFPFSESSFDLVSVGGHSWGVNQPVEVRDIVRDAHGLLKDGGTVYLSFRNRLAFQDLLKWGKSSAPFRLHTAYGYRRILQAEGFSEIQFYAPLPRYDGIPLFYLPLENSHALNFFLRNIFPLFEMVSPEVKRAYAMEYAVAKLGVRLTLLFRLATLAKIFVPGFNIVAKKTGKGTGK